MSQYKKGYEKISSSLLEFLIYTVSVGFIAWYSYKFLVDVFL